MLVKSFPFKRLQKQIGVDGLSLNARTLFQFRHHLDLFKEGKEEVYSQCREEGEIFSDFQRGAVIAADVECQAFEILKKIWDIERAAVLTAAMLRRHRDVQRGRLPSRSPYADQCMISAFDYLLDILLELPSTTLSQHLFGLLCVHARVGFTSNYGVDQDRMDIWANVQHYFDAPYKTAAFLESECEKSKWVVALDQDTQQIVGWVWTWEEKEPASTVMMGIRATLRHFILSHAAKLTQAKAAQPQPNKKLSTCIIEHVLSENWGKPTTVFEPLGPIPDILAKYGFRKVQLREHYNMVHDEQEQRVSSV